MPHTDSATNLAVSSYHIIFQQPTCSSQRYPGSSGMALDRLFFIERVDFVIFWDYIPKYER